MIRIERVGRDPVVIARRNHGVIHIPNASVYDRAYPLYRELYGELKGSFAKLAEL